MDKLKKISLMMFMCLIIIISAHGAVPAQPIILGYYSDYGAKYMPRETVQYKYFNHISRAFFKSDVEGEMIYDADFDYDKFVSSAHQNGTKVLLALSGGTNGELFGQMVSNDEARHRYLQQVLAFAKQYDFDGVDIDWEFPKHGQEELLIQLVRELHSALKAWRSDSVITIAVPAYYRSVPYTVASELMPYIDYWNIMTYDFHGPWSEHAGLLSALFPTTNDPVDGDIRNMQFSLNYWLERGVPKERLLLGIPAYGYGFSHYCPAKDHEILSISCSVLFNGVSIGFRKRFNSGS